MIHTYLTIKIEFNLKYYIFGIIIALLILFPQLYLVSFLEILLFNNSNIDLTLFNKLVF